MTIDINKLRRLAQAATPGPWIGCGPSFGESLPKYLNEVVVDREGDEDDGYSICNAPIGLDEEHSADMAFIAAANPAVINELLDRLEAAEEEVKNLREGLKRMCLDEDAAAKEAKTLRAKIAEMEKQEPAAWMDKNGTLYNTVSHVRASDRPLYLTTNVSEGWLRAIDNALVVAHIGVADKSDTYEQAKEKLDNLIGFHVDEATDPAVNGGWKPAPSVPDVPAKSLKPVIDWLRNGCDPMKAADELEILIAAAPEAKP